MVQWSRSVEICWIQNPLVIGATLSPEDTPSQNQNIPGSTCNTTYIITTYTKPGASIARDPTCHPMEVGAACAAAGAAGLHLAGVDAMENDAWWKWMEMVGNGGNMIYQHLIWSHRCIVDSGRNRSANESVRGNMHAQTLCSIIIMQPHSRRHFCRTDALRFGLFGLRLFGHSGQRAYAQATTGPTTLKICTSSRAGTSRSSRLSTRRYLSGSYHLFHVFPS